ncbi:MAG: o-succinylbenzoate--CoA ligase [Gammaproteobacteria bacterium]|jgi:acyl-CoA synthetase (AMP-forming)/AMP-acid ligase II|nr:o-succinylbenzoate--CoA ligase [Gammaproteobacteria bacterium]
MNPLKTLFHQMDHFAENEAFIWRGQSYSYRWLSSSVELQKSYLNKQGITEGALVTLIADYSPASIAILLALFKLNCIVTLLSPHMSTQLAECLALTEAEYLIGIDANDQVEILKQSAKPDHPYWKELHQRKHSGLVLFSSGSTGKSKAIVHDAIDFMEKHTKPKKQARVIGFLLFDHIGGLNTLFYTLFNGGCFIILDKRDATTVCKAIEEHQADALTTSPTFLTLMLVSKTYEKFNLSSLQVINYGTERMPESTLEQLQTMFPNVRLSQAYGLSEVGVLPIRSESSNSLWFTLDTEICPYRIVHGSLEIKIKTSMLGYLNADSPFTEDGWFITGDAVELHGNRLKILGRKSELINVGGEKVYPAEIENIIQTMPEVEEVAISHRPSALIGNLITARIKLKLPIPEEEFKKKLYEFCEARLPRYKIPRKIMLTESPIHNERFKKMRKQEAI